MLSKILNSTTLQSYLFVTMMTIITDNKQSIIIVCCSLPARLRESNIRLGQFQWALKTHLFGHWQLQRRVTVFFVRCVQICLLPYLLNKTCTKWNTTKHKMWKSTSQINCIHCVHNDSTGPHVDRTAVAHSVVIHRYFQCFGGEISRCATQFYQPNHITITSAFCTSLLLCQFLLN